jgi:hypothetical protein
MTTNVNFVPYTALSFKERKVSERLFQGYGAGIHVAEKQYNFCAKTLKLKDLR